MQTEALQYNHHAAMLRAHGKTLNRFDYKGFVIRQVVDGFFINNTFFETKALAEKSVDSIQDDRIKFVEVFGSQGLSVFPNTLNYHCGYGEADSKATAANILIEKYGLKLHATATTMAGKNSFTVSALIA